MSPRRSFRLAVKPRLDYSQMVKQVAASKLRTSASSTDVVPKRRICANFIDGLLIVNIGLMLAFAASSYDIIHSNYLLNTMSMYHRYML